MPGLCLVVDSSVDLPASVCEELDVVVVRARYAFEEHAFADGELSPTAFYQRMTNEGRAPRPFGVPEAEFSRVFRQGLDQGRPVVCLVMPFDVSPSFTTACAAMLGLDLEDSGSRIKIFNPGAASAGLCSLTVSLGAVARAGCDRDKLLAAVDEFGPMCDTLFVPADVAWLERAGRLPLIEDRIGEIAGGVPVVRVGTRITGVALAGDRQQALQRAVATVAARAGTGRSLIVTIDHADAPDAAAEMTEMAQASLDIARLIVTELSATIGSQLGPGAVGIGVAPATLA
jgi:DegV family protein with EDD domain